MRVRINLSLSEAEHRQIEEIARVGRYSTACAFVHELLNGVIRFRARKMRELDSGALSVEEEIDAMFRELMEWDTAEASQHRAAVYANEKPR